MEVIRIEPGEDSFAEAVNRLKNRFSLAILLGVPHEYKLKILKQYGKKVVMRLTGYRLDELQNDPHYMGLFPYLREVDRFISLSAPLSRSVEKSGLDVSRVVEIPNMVDAQYYSPAEPDERQALRQSLLNIPPDAPLIVFVGNFRFEKGADILFEAWKTVRAENEKAYLLLLGPLCSKCGGTDRPCEERGAATARVDETLDLLTGKFSHLVERHERIIFAGVKENIRDYLRASDIFLFPTRREGMPNSLMEAMACSLACVTSGIEEITSELIPNESFGLAVPGENPQDYAQAVLTLLADADLRERIGKNARRRMKDKFSPSLIRSRYCNLIADILYDN